jgi:hypothetical protein
MRKTPTIPLTTTLLTVLLLAACASTAGTPMVTGTRVPTVTKSPTNLHNTAITLPGQSTNCRCQGQGDEDCPGRGGSRLAKRSSDRMARKQKPHQDYPCLNPHADALKDRHTHPNRHAYANSNSNRYAYTYDYPANFTGKL